MSDRLRSALIVTVRLLTAALCVAVVVLARTSAGWGSLGLMLVALIGLLAVIASYNRSHR